LDGWRAAPRWAGWWPRAGESFRQAYVRLLWSVPHGGLVFLRVGRFVEFYGPQRLRAERVLGLRAAALPRAGYAFLAGFPVRRTPRFAARALAAGCAVVLAGREARPGIVLLAPAIRAPVHAPGDAA
ncbi:MAG: hypothetical protein IT294_15625, partial [Deltaproteobacteria bacterium]|nr:hypothetical protein [Deltaproteobacteria bacterium]